MKLLACSLLVAACARTPAPAAISHHHVPSPVPSGWTALVGPLAGPMTNCAPDDECRLGHQYAITAGDIRSVAMVERGASSVLAIETRLGWFTDRMPDIVLRMGHHQPHGSSFDPAHTRVVGDAVIFRSVEHQASFYPGQGPVGTSSTTWSERSCRVIDAVVYCSEGATIATQRCKTEMVPGGTGRPDYERTCTGAEPRNAPAQAPARAAVVADDSHG